MIKILQILKFIGATEERFSLPDKIFSYKNYVFTLSTSDEGLDLILEISKLDNGIYSHVKFCRNEKQSIDFIKKEFSYKFRTDKINKILNGKSI